MFDIVISCVYIAYALQPWIAIIVRLLANLTDSIHAYPKLLCR